MYLDEKINVALKNYFRLSKGNSNLKRVYTQSVLYTNIVLEIMEEVDATNVINAMYWNSW